MENLTPEMKKLFLAAYSLGFWDSNGGLQEFNGHKTEEKKLGWIEDCLFIEKETFIKPYEEDEIELINSVS